MTTLTPAERVLDLETQIKAGKNVDPDTFAAARAALATHSRMEAIRQQGEQERAVEQERNDLVERQDEARLQVSIQFVTADVDLHAAYDDAVEALETLNHEIAKYNRAIQTGATTLREAGYSPWNETFQTKPENSERFHDEVYAFVGQGEPGLVVDRVRRAVINEGEAALAAMVDAGHFEHLYRCKNSYSDWLRDLRDYVSGSRTIIPKRHHLPSDRR